MSVPDPAWRAAAESAAPLRRRRTLQDTPLILVGLQRRPSAIHACAWARRCSWRRRRRVRASDATARGRDPILRMLSHRPMAYRWDPFFERSPDWTAQFMAPLGATMSMAASPTDAVLLSIALDASITRNVRAWYAATYQAALSRSDGARDVRGVEDLRCPGRAGLQSPRADSCRGNGQSFGQPARTNVEDEAMTQETMRRQDTPRSRVTRVPCDCGIRSLLSSGVSLGTPRCDGRAAGTGEEGVIVNATRHSERKERWNSKAKPPS